MNTEELKEIIRKHQLWLTTDPDGEKADLRYADLRSANLRSADLRYADLRSANLSYADLRYANLRSADLRYADLRSADLSYANLRSADLRSANLRSADLRYANLRSANLSYADLRSANLSYADLLTFQFNRDTAYYQFDGKIRIGCEYHPIEYWSDQYRQIGLQSGYSGLEIEVYGSFINTCRMLEDSK